MDPAQLYRDAAEAAYRRLPRSARPAARRLHHRVVPTLGALRRRLHATAAQVRRPAAPSVVSDPRRARRAQCDSPRVTVVMPVRDAAPYVEAAVRSVLEQDLEELELVVVDDGSLDRTTDLVADIAARDGRLRLLRHGEPLGPSAARNDGIAAATAPFLCFLDGDDLMYPSSLRSRWEAAVVAPPGAAGSYCGWESIGPDEVPRSPQRGTPSLPRVSYLQADGECPFIISAPLVRTDVVRAVGGFDEALHAAEDFDLWLRLLREGWWFDPVGVIGVAYRQHGSGIMRTDVIGFVDGVTAVYDSL
ncbi:MAG: glycosyltransferase family A protein [Actinomycetota bacterium]